MRSECGRSGSSVLYFPGAEIIHLGGQSVGRFPIRFALETYRSGYRFFYKHYGRGGLMGIRRVYLLRLYVRQIGYSLHELGEIERVSAKSPGDVPCSHQVESTSWTQCDSSKPGQEPDVRL